MGCGGGGSAHAPGQVASTTTPRTPECLCGWCLFAPAVAGTRAIPTASIATSPFLIALILTPARYPAGRSEPTSAYFPRQTERSMAVRWVTFARDRNRTWRTSFFADQAFLLRVCPSNLTS